MNQFTTSGRLWARWGLDPQAGLLDGILVEWMLGRYTLIEERREPPPDLPDTHRHPRAILTPGLLNAHCHLDYSFLLGELPAGGDFVRWVEAIIRVRRGMQDQLRERQSEACARALEQMIANGITEVWDIDSRGGSRARLLESPLRWISFDEIIAPTRDAWEGHGRARLNEHKMAAYINPPDHARLLGLSPHSTYTVAPLGLEACSHWAGRRHSPLAIHLAECPEENQMLIEGEGPLLELMENVCGAPLVEQLDRGFSPLARARRAGALNPSTLAIHCNCPQPGEETLLAAQAVAVAFCPRSHRYFDYPPYPLETYLEAGVRIALGSDSLASNDRLCIRSEARLLSGRALEPLDLLGLATGALLGEWQPFGGRGLLETGYPAAWALWEPDGLPLRPDSESMVACWLDADTRCLESSAMHTLSANQ